MKIRKSIDSLGPPLSYDENSRARENIMRTWKNQFLAESRAGYTQCKLSPLSLAPSQFLDWLLWITQRCIFSARLRRQSVSLVCQQQPLWIPKLPSFSKLIYFTSPLSLSFHCILVDMRSHDCFELRCFRSYHTVWCCNRSRSITTMVAERWLTTKTKLSLEWAVFRFTYDWCRHCEVLQLPVVSTSSSSRQYKLSHI